MKWNFLANNQSYSIEWHALHSHCTCLSMGFSVAKNRHILESLILMLSLCLQTYHNPRHSDGCVLHSSPLIISERIDSGRAYCGTAVNHIHCMVRLFIVIYNGQTIHSTIIRIVLFCIVLCILQTKSLIIIFMEIFWWQHATHKRVHILARGQFVLCASALFSLLFMLVSIIWWCE